MTRARWIALAVASWLAAPAAAQAQRAYHWSGVYVGVNAGLAVGQSNTSSRQSLPFPGAQGLAHDLNRSGGAVGAQIGVNWHFAPNWLFGLEGDLNYLHVNRTSTDYRDSFQVGMETDWYATARARFGYVAGPSLLYVTGGFAAVSVSHLFGGDLNLGVAPFETSKTAGGYVVGGGVETQLNRNWSTRLEYLYLDAGDHVIASNPYGTSNSAIFQNHFHLVRAGLNYRFGDAVDATVPTYARNWAGFYVGALLGSAVSLTHLDGVVGGAGEVSVNGHGVSGGLQAGYNVMLSPIWFAGLEGDVSYMTVQRSFVNFDDLYMPAQKADWYATLRGRVGVNTGAALLYLTGGAAVVNVRTEINNFSLPPGVTREAALGWTFGAGTEVALNARWSAKVEALHIDVGSTEDTTYNTGGSPRAVEFHRAFQMVRFGLNYRLGDDAGRY